MKKVWINITGSFQEAEKFDKRYYQLMSKTGRLETVQFLREVYDKLRPLIPIAIGTTGSSRRKSGSKSAFNKTPKLKRVTNEGRKRLRRVVKIIQ